MPLFGSRNARPNRPTDILERPDYGWVWKPLLGLVAVYLVVTLALGVWWSLTPDGFDVQQASAEQRGRLAPDAQTHSDAQGAENDGGSVAAATDDSEATKTALDTSPAGRGAVIIATQMTLLDTLLDKSGGYVRNDMLPPGLWLDNMPAWELGVLEQARSQAHSLVEQADMEAGALVEAQERLDGDSQDWLYPATEHRLNKANDAYAVVLNDINEQRQALPAEGDVPADWLSRVAMRLEEMTYRLSASVADPEALRELEVDVDQLPGRTPWYRVDNIFFEARGQTWALEHLLAAMAADYGDVLAAAEAQALVDRLMAELEQAQRPLWSPMVLNGTGFGIFANHSLMMAAYTQRAARLAEALSERLAGVSAPAEPVNPTSAAETSSQADAQSAAQPPVSEGAGASSEGAAKVDAAPQGAASDVDTQGGDGADASVEEGASEPSSAEKAGPVEKTEPAETTDPSVDGQDASATLSAEDADVADEGVATDSGD
ncbi:DUF2333 family protein [Onishia niordana]|uniref:DUF2333 family protein n=1 Tax=Onishia niordana TaxID=2508711 RepID=UPI00109FCC9F|nr:DUF2333 family protein [Halomonas niordiana]